MKKVKIVKDVPGTAGAVRWAAGSEMFMSPTTAEKWVAAGYAEYIPDEPVAEEVA